MTSSLPPPLYCVTSQPATRGLDVKLSHDDSQEHQGIYRLDIELTLHGELDKAQRQQLLRVANKCPIHKLMTSSEVQVSTQLREDTQ